MEEAGAHLQADGKDEEDETELLHEVEDTQIGPEAQMTHQDAHEQNPGGSQGDAFHFESAQIEADTYH